MSVGINRRKSWWSEFAEQKEKNGELEVTKACANAFRGRGRKGKNNGG